MHKDLAGAAGPYFTALMPFPSNHADAAQRFAVEWPFVSGCSAVVDPAHPVVYVGAVQRRS